MIGHTLQNLWRSGPAKLRRPLVGALAVAVATSGLMASGITTALAAPGGPSGDGIQPAEFSGNLSCAQLNGDGVRELKVEPVADGTYTDGTLSVTIDVRNTNLGQVFDWTSNIIVHFIFVKGGNGGNLYDYRPAGDKGDTGLHAPINAQNNRYFGLSHLSFCYVPVRDTQLTVEKTAVDSTITVGEKFAYDLTVRDVADGVDAINATVSDSLQPAGFDWAIVAQDGTACSIDDVPDPNVLSCSFPILADGTSYSLRVQTTTAATADNCGRTYTNIAVADADNTPPVQDDASITVECGAVRVNKVAKNAQTEDPTDTVAVAGAGFELYDAAGTTLLKAQVLTDAAGLACFDGLAVDTQYTLRESAVPAGYAPVADRLVTSSAAHADCAGSGSPTTVEVENTPLTDVRISINSQVPGGTKTIITCDDPTTATNPDYQFTTDPTGDGFLDILNLPPVILNCTINIDP
jgi:hypothetical protein